MNAKKLIVAALAPALMALSVGLPGCGSEYEETHLANVPPPPPGFGVVKVRKPVRGHKVVHTPDNISQYYK